MKKKLVVNTVVVRKKKGKVDSVAIAKNHKETAKKTDWQTLYQLIEDYVGVAIAESWKGGGDPLEIPVLEAELVLARLKLSVHIEQMMIEADGELR